jgi:hypothetical protein
MYRGRSIRKSAGARDFATPEVAPQGAWFAAAASIGGASAFGAIATI